MMPKDNNSFTLIKMCDISDILQVAFVNMTDFYTSCMVSDVRVTSVKPVSRLENNILRSKSRCQYRHVNPVPTMQNKGKCASAISFLQNNGK